MAGSDKTAKRGVAPLRIDETRRLEKTGRMNEAGSIESTLAGLPREKAGLELGWSARDGRIRCSSQ